MQSRDSCLFCIGVVHLLGNKATGVCSIKQLPLVANGKGLLTDKMDTIKGESCGTAFVPWF